MSEVSVVGKLGAFLRRDFLITASYRLAWGLQLVDIFFMAALAYFLAQFFRQQGLETVTPFARDYFAFVILGLAFFDYLSTGLDSFSRSLREGQLTGTLETLLVTQTGLGTIVWGSALSAFFSTTLRVGVYLLAGVTVFGLSLTTANWGMTAALLLLSVAAFSSLGILSACFILLFKKGNPFNWVVLSASAVAGGVFYPVSALPEWLQSLAQWLPITHCLEGVRRALLAGAGWRELWPQVAALALFAGVGVPLALALFHWSVGRAKVTGALAHY
ncbi:MAG: ABC transporter permease [Terriglobia bacterium]